MATSAVRTPSQSVPHHDRRSAMPSGNCVVTRSSDAQAAKTQTSGGTNAATSALDHRTARATAAPPTSAHRKPTTPSMAKPYAASPSRAVMPINWPYDIEPPNDHPMAPANPTSATRSRRNGHGKAMHSASADSAPGIIAPYSWPKLPRMPQPMACASPTSTRGVTMRMSRAAGQVGPVSPRAG